MFTRLSPALAAAFVALALAPGCHRKKKEPVRVVEGDGAALPRQAHAAAPTRASVRTVLSGGKERRYVLVEPAETERERPYPVVLVFHGDGGDAPGFHAAWPFERASGGEAILAYPEGRGRTWDLETTRDNPDVRFAEDVLADVERIARVDRGRLFATGYSSGGFFANVLACHRPGLLRAISSSAGGAPYKQREKWDNGYPKCPGQEPVAMLALHGERDLGVTLDSGRFSAEYWAYVNQCDTREMETTGYAECHVYRGCPPGKAVGFCSVPTLGHWVWDQAAEASWTFFRLQ